MHSLRERKKADTREAIRGAAVDLFCRDGFEATTMDAVAEAADVSVRTVFRYFPTKEDLVFADVEADLADLRDAARRPARRRAGHGQRAGRRGGAGRPDGRWTRRPTSGWPRCCTTSRRCASAISGCSTGWRTTVADWARLRLGAGPGDLRPGLLAACMVSVQRVVVDAVVAGDPRPLSDLIREAVALLGRGFDQLDG